MTESPEPAIARERVRALLREHRETLGLSAAELERLPHAWPGDWWARHGLTDEHHTYLLGEARATGITVYQSMLIPGLLQTPRYARAATAAVLRTAEDDPDVTVRVGVRADRLSTIQARTAAGDAPMITAIVDEVVLRRAVGGAGVLREQLDHLVEVAGHPHVTLVVLPTALGGHAGLGGVFELLEFGADPGPALVFIESAAADHIVRDAAAVTRYREIAAELARVGSSGAEAVDFVRSVRSGLE